MSKKKEPIRVEDTRGSLPQQMDIPGYGGKYYLKIDGTIWRRYRGGAPDVQLQGTANRRNRDFKLTIDGQTRCCTMGAIMKKTYFKGLPDGWSLQHKNGLGQDWAVWNLRPLPKEELGRRSYRALDAKNVLKVDPDTGEVLEIYSSAREAGRANFCSYQTILDACNKVNKKRPGIAPDGYRYSWQAASDGFM